MLKPLKLNNFISNFYIFYAQSTSYSNNLTFEFNVICISKNKLSTKYILDISK